MQPDPKYDDYEQVRDNGKATGFKLKDDPFFYAYDQYGGWRDAEGKYFNKDAINCEPHYESDSEEEEKIGEEEEVKALNMEMGKLTLRHEAIRELLAIIDSYPENQLVHLEVDDQKRILTDKDLNSLLSNSNLNFSNNAADVTKEVASRLVELEGKRVNNTQIYLYVRVFDSSPIEVETTLSQQHFEDKLSSLQLTKNTDFGNIEISDKGYSLEANAKAMQLLESQKDIKICKE